MDVKRMGIEDKNNSRSCIYRKPICLIGVGLVVIGTFILAAIMGKFWIGFYPSVHCCNTITGDTYIDNFWATHQGVATIEDWVVFGWITVIFGSGSIIMSIFGFSIIYATYIKLPLDVVWNWKKALKIWEFILYCITLSTVSITLIWVLITNESPETIWNSTIDSYRFFLSISFEDFVNTVVIILSLQIFAFSVIIIGGIISWTLNKLAVYYLHKCEMSCSYNDSLVNVVFGTDIGKVNKSFKDVLKEGYTLKKPQKGDV